MRERIFLARLHRALCVASLASVVAGGAVRAAPTSPVAHERPPPGVAGARPDGSSGAGTAGSGAEGAQEALAQVPLERRRFVDAEGGHDGAAGDLDHPWRTLAHALSRLRAGDTLFLRGGIYAEAGLEIDQQGSAREPTTIRNFPAEKVIVDGSLPAFRRGGAGVWELVDAGTATYRSSGSEHGREVYVGKVHADSGERFALVPYWEDAGRARGLADLRSEVYGVSRGARYVGPGLYNDGGRLYIRLQPLPLSALHGREVRIPTATDPNEVDLHLTSRSAVFEISGSHVRLAGLELAGARRGVEIEGRGDHVELRDLHFDVPGGALLVRDGASEVLLENSLIEGDFPPWVAWTDMKGGDGQSRPASYSSFKVSGGGGGFVRNLTVRDNEYVNVFDGMVLDGENIEFDGNRGVFIDDLIQLGSNSANVRIHDNRIEGAGPSHNGKGDSARPGTVYIHHNVIDSTREILWGKPDPEGVLRAGYRGWRGHRPFPDHTSDELERGDPWKIYHNTLRFDGATSSDGAGFQLWDERNGTGVAHEVYNNVLVERGGGKFARGIDIGAGPQVYDGNVYWRENGGGAPLWEEVRTSEGEREYASLETWRGSRGFEESRRWYAPGWESGGTESDPRLDAALRPGAGGSAASGAVEMPPELPGPRHAYRGALSPR